MVKRAVVVDVADGSFPIEVAPAATLPSAVVVIVPSIFGLNDETDRLLATYVAAGYTAVVYDPFWRTDPGSLEITDDADRLRAQRRRDAFVADDGIRDLRAVVDVIRAAPECNGNVAVAGYCFGGRYALIAAARLDVQAALAFHGIRMGDNLDDARAVRVPASFHFGNADHSTPMTEVHAIEAAVAGNPNVELCVYDGAGHSFTWHGHKLYHPVADEASWERAMALLAPLAAGRKTPA